MKRALKLFFAVLGLMLVRPNRRVVRQFVENFGEGGLEQVVFDLHRELTREGIDSKIIVWNTVSPTMRSLVNDPSSLIELRRDHIALFTHLRRERVGTVNWHYSTTSQRLVRFAGVRTVYTLHNSYTWMDYTSARRWFLRVARFRHIVAVSNSVREYFVARNSLFDTRTPRVEVIPNGIDQVDLPRRARSRSKAKFLNAAVVSNFHDVKSLPSLIGLSHELTRRGVAFRFHVFGGPLESDRGQALKSLIDNEGLAESIRLRGSTSHSGVIRALASSEFGLFVSPSLQEGCSIALLEAISIGLPVVTTETGNAATCADISKSVKTVALPFSSPLLLNPERITEWGNSPQLDNVMEFADAIEVFAKDPIAALADAVAATDTFREMFSAPAMATAYRAVYGIRAES